MTRTLLVALAVAALLLPSPAWAHGGSAPARKVNASELPPSAAKRLILELQKKLRQDKLPPEIVERPIGEAIRAADRARGARDAGDMRSSSLLTKLAEQWASAGKAVLRAVRAERAAKQEAKRLSELATKVKRAEALLHEQQSRLGRLRAELKRLQEKTKGQEGAAAEAEKKRIDKSGTKAPRRPPKKGGTP